MREPNNIERMLIEELPGGNWHTYDILRSSADFSKEPTGDKKMLAEIICDFDETMTNFVAFYWCVVKSADEHKKLMGGCNTLCLVGGVWENNDVVEEKSFAESFVAFLSEEGEWQSLIYDEKSNARAKVAFSFVEYTHKALYGAIGIPMSEVRQKLEDAFPLFYGDE